MSREVKHGDLLVTIAMSAHGGNWRWQVDDASGEVCAATWGRAELRQVRKDLELLLGCALDPITSTRGAYVGYTPVGRNNVAVVVER